MPEPRLAALSVDLDEIPCYTSIHGLTPPDEDAAHAIYRKALPRFVALFDTEKIPATFFVVGRDAERDRNARALRALKAAGHEIGNHTRDHLYDLTRQSRDRISSQIALGSEAIETAIGAPPAGFRAPGYTVTDTVFEVLAELGYEYDSSVFPCPTYYAAKAAALGAIRVRGRRSHSILDDPRVLRAPADPYRVSRPYWRRGTGPVELPIGVTRAAFGRLPYIGTSVVTAGSRGAAWLTRAIVGRPLVNLELHGIDLADAEADGLRFLHGHQPDLRRRRHDKESALRAAVDVLRHAGYRFVTLSEAARTLAA